MNNRIVIVMPSLTSGGAERVISLLCNRWIQQGYTVDLILWNARNRFYSIDDNINIIDLDFRFQNKFERFLKQFLVLFLLRRHLKKIKPKFVLSFLPLNNIVTLLSSLFLNLNVIISERNNPKELNIDLSEKLFFLRNYLYKKYAKGIIAQTELAKELILKEFPNKKIIAIPNPVKNLNLLRNNVEENLLVNVGRLHPQKGHLDLIEIISKLQTQNVKLVILGEGYLRDKIEEKIKKLHLENKVQLMGAVNNIEDWLSRAALFVFSSKYEGFPNALAEAMIAGIPSISYDCDTGPSELINDSINGFLVELDNQQDFANKIDRLLNDKKLRDQFSIESKKLSSELDEDMISQRYLNFCLDVIL